MSAPLLDTHAWVWWVQADPRLASFMAQAAERFLTVPDPRLAVLKDTPRLFRAIRIRLTEPG